MSNYLLPKSFLALHWGLKKKNPPTIRVNEILNTLKKLLYMGSSEAGLCAGGWGGKAAGGDALLRALLGDARHRNCCHISERHQSVS